MTTLGRASRACDGCRIRKVKCDGAQPCSQCAHFNVSCIVTPPSKRKNPVRGRLVAKARGEEGSFNTATKDSSTSPTSDTETKAPGTDPSGFSPTSTRDGDTSGRSLFDSLSMSIGYDTGFFTDLLPQYEEIVYPVNPILTSSDISEAIGNFGNSFEDTALVFAFGAITIFLARSTDILSGGVSTQMDELMRHSLEAHRRADLVIGPGGRLVEEPSVSLKRIMTCIFLEVTMMPFKRYDRSFALIREAITMLQTIKSQHEMDQSPEVARFQRAYWEAFIHERFLTIAAGYPSVLPPLSSGHPEYDPCLSPKIGLGFNRLISLFCILDSTFLAYWSKEDSYSDPPIPELDVHWIERKQAQLDEDEQSVAQADHELVNSGRGGLTELQHADIYVTRLWLRTIIWQLALSRGLLRSGPLSDTHEGLSLHFPAQRLSTQLKFIVSRLESLASISTHGSGIVQKLFEITSTITDVLALPLAPDQSQGDMHAQVEDVIFLVKFLFRFGRIRDQQKQYLREKLDTLQQQYPLVADHILP